MRHLARNLELKARLSSLGAARDVARRLATEGPVALRQVDTYFPCPGGRLKLRETEGEPAQLIWYQRRDQTDAKVSDYLIAPVGDPRALADVLARSLGRDVVVEKHRELYWCRNVRVHLDDVRGLGHFLEFEAVLQPGEADSVGAEPITFLRGQFGIDDAMLIARSYSDLLRDG